MVLLDAGTHAEIAGSAFVAEEFGRLKQKEADSSVAGSYRTLGIAGRNTLIELFGGELGGGGLRGGLVFSFEEPGSSKAARDLLTEHDVTHHADLVRRAVDGEQQPWYHLIAVNLGEASPFLLLLNEVTPEYFTSLGAVPAADGTMSRRAYLDAVLGEPAPRLLGDVTGVTLRTTPDRARGIAAALTPFGYDEREDGDVLEVSGPELTLRLERGEDERVTELTLALNPEVPRPAAREYRFGASELVFETTTARWTFS